MKELILKFSDLKTISIRCKCGLEILFHLNARIVIPRRCPSCEADFDEASIQAIELTDRAIKLAQRENLVSLRVPDPD